MAFKILGLVFIPGEDGSQHILTAVLGEKRSRSSSSILGEQGGDCLEKMVAELFSKMMGDCCCRCKLKRIGEYYIARGIVKIEGGVETVQMLRNKCPARALMGALVKAYNQGIHIRRARATAN